MLENLVPAPRATRVQYRVPARGAARSALTRICVPRERAYARPASTTCGGIMNDAVLVCIPQCAYGQVDTDQPELQI